MHLSRYLHTNSRFTEFTDIEDEIEKNAEVPVEDDPNGSLKHEIPVRNTKSTEVSEVL